MKLTTIDDIDRATLRFTVPGIPQPQGSIRSLGKGRPSIHGNAERLLPWRAAVTAHCQQAMRDGGVWPLTGPVCLHVVFALPRPASAPKNRSTPDKRPDLSHLVRAVEDAITAAGAWQDDGQIVRCVSRKVWPSTAMPGPACSIEVHPW